MQVDEAIHCRIHICRSQTSSHPVLSWYPCTACDNRVCRRGLQEGSCTGFLQQMSAKNGPQEQRRGLQEGSCSGFLQQMSAKKWAAGTLAPFGVLKIYKEVGWGR